MVSAQLVASVTAEVETWVILRSALAPTTELLRLEDTDLMASEALESTTEAVLIEEELLEPMEARVAEAAMAAKRTSEPSCLARAAMVV